MVWWAYETDPHRISIWWEGKLKHKFGQRPPSDISIDVMEQMRSYAGEIYAEAVETKSPHTTSHLKHVVDWTDLSHRVPSMKKCLYKFRDRLISAKIYVVAPTKTFTWSPRRHLSSFVNFYSITKDDTVTEVTTNTLTNSDAIDLIIAELEFTSKFPSKSYGWANNVFYRFLRHNKQNKKSFKRVNKNASATSTT